MKKLLKLLAVMAILTMTLVLTSCGKTAEIDMTPYLSASPAGTNGNGMVKLEFDFTAFEYEIMSHWKDGAQNMDDLAALSALEQTVRYEAVPAEGLSNGDTVTVTITADEELAKEMGYTFTGMERTLTVEGLEEVIAVDPFDPAVFGPDGPVCAYFEGDSPEIKLRLQNLSSWEDIHAYIYYRADKDWNLSVGDTVTIYAQFMPVSRAQDLQYDLSRTELTVTVGEDWLTPQ